MKKILQIFVSTIIVLTILLIPFSAFSATNGNYDYVTLNGIMDDYDIVNNTRLFLKGSDGNFYCFESAKGIYYAYDSNGYLCYYHNNYEERWVKVWQFDSNNIYKEPTLIINKSRDIPSGKEHPIVDVFPNTVNSLKFIACSVDVYDYDDTSIVVFTARSQSVTEPGVTPPEQTQGSTLPSLITSERLANVLEEVIHILPILIPILVIYIAVRKGLKFVLTQLRTV